MMSMTISAPVQVDAVIVGLNTNLVRDPVPLAQLDDVPHAGRDRVDVPLLLAAPPIRSAQDVYVLHPEELQGHPLPVPLQRAGRAERSFLVHLSTSTAIRADIQLSAVVFRIDLS